MKLIQSFNTATQSLMARLFTQMPTRSNCQRGASALEYIVLVALIVVIIVLAISFLDRSAVSGVFAPIKSAIENTGTGT